MVFGLAPRGGFSFGAPAATGFFLAGLLGFSLAVGATAAASPLTLDGAFTVGSFLYPEQASPGRDVEWEIGGEWDLSWRPAVSWRARVKPRFWWDPLTPGRWRWLPRQAWIEYRARGFGLRVGRQTLTWGSADTYRPTDVVGTEDWGRDFLDPEKVGNCSLTFDYGASRWGVELVFLPGFEGVRFPAAASPWSLESAQSRLGKFVLPLIRDPLTVGGVSNNSLASRVRLTLGRTDLRLVGYHGVDRQPFLTVTEQCRDPECAQSTLAYQATYLPLRLVGLEVQTAVRGLVLKLEATHRDQTTSDPAYSHHTTGWRSRSTQAVAGLDYLWSDPLGARGDLQITAELLYDDSTDRGSVFAYRPFQRDLALALTYLSGDLHATTVEAGWVQDLENREAVGRLRVRRRLLHALTGEVGGDWILGPNDPADPFHVFAPNDRLLFRLVYGF